jgi:hypothetical protein
MAAPRRDGEHQQWKLRLRCAARVILSPVESASVRTGCNRYTSHTIVTSASPGWGEASAAGFVVWSTRLAVPLIALGKNRLEIQVALDATHDVVADRVAVAQREQRVTLGCQHR